MNHNPQRDLQNFAAYLADTYPIQIARIVNADFTPLQKWLRYRLSDKSVDIIEMEKAKISYDKWAANNS